MIRETIIKNKWTKENEVCYVLWHYEKGRCSYITIVGYNPFPFFGNNENDGKLYTSYSVFTSWMIKNGWQPTIIQTNVISKMDFYK